MAKKQRSGATPVEEKGGMTPINHITLAVSDVERSFRFYRDLLGLTPVMKGKAGAYLLDTHVGTLETRLRDLKENPRDTMELY